MSWEDLIKLQRGVVSYLMFPRVIFKLAHENQWDTDALPHARRLVHLLDED